MFAYTESNAAFKSKGFIEKRKEGFVLDQILDCPVASCGGREGYHILLRAF